MEICFESETDFFTGKSLSLICGALTWFLASEKRRKEQLENQVKDKVEEEDEVGFDINPPNIASILTHDS